MKNILIIILLILLISFTPESEKEYNLKFNEVKLNKLWNALDKSNAPHNEVKELQEDIQNQLKDQLPKPPIDTSKTKK